MNLFNRKYELIIGEEGQTGFILKDLDIHFSIKKGSDSETSQNKLSLIIYNLSYAHRNTLMTKENCVLILKAGYEENIQTIFQGKIIKCASKKNGVDFETEIEAGDGYQALKKSNSSLSFPPNTNALQIVKALCDDLISQDSDLSFGSIYHQDLLSNKNFLNGYSCIGSTKSELKKILTPLKMTFSIQNQILFVAPLNKKTQETSVFLLSKNSGLIHSPQKFKNDSLSPNEEGAPANGVTFECLLNGALNPMNMVKIESAEASRVYKIIATEHSGEFLGENWSTKCTAIEVNEDVK